MHTIRFQKSFQAAERYQVLVDKMDARAMDYRSDQQDPVLIPLLGGLKSGSGDASPAPSSSSFGRTGN